MEIVEVTAYFDAQGNVTPKSFRWNGRNYVVESTGRRWQDDAGQHILVMAGGERVFELLFALPEGRWYLQPTSQTGQMA